MTVTVTVTLVMWMPLRSIMSERSLKRPLLLHTSVGFSSHLIQGQCRQMTCNLQYTQQVDNVNYSLAISLLFHSSIGKNRPYMSNQ